MAFTNDVSTQGGGGFSQILTKGRDVVWIWYRQGAGGGGPKTPKTSFVNGGSCDATTISSASAGGATELTCLYAETEDGRNSGVVSFSLGGKSVGPHRRLLLLWQQYTNGGGDERNL